MNDDEYIPLDQCEKGAVYRIKCRNFSHGVFDGDEGFIGVRFKFGHEYLFTEYHWDQGPPFGTVKPQEKVCEVPEGIPIVEGFSDSVKGFRENKLLFDFLQDLD